MRCPDVAKIYQRNCLPKHTVNGHLLTGHEYKIFQLIGRGFSTHEIAAQLKTKDYIIGYAKEKLKKKLKLKHCAELATYATREQVKEEIKNWDFVRDDLLAEWLSKKLSDVKAQHLLDLILEFRLLTQEEVTDTLEGNGLDE